MATDYLHKSMKKWFQLVLSFQINSVDNHCDHKMNQCKIKSHSLLTKFIFPECTYVSLVCYLLQTRTFSSRSHQQSLLTYAVIKYSVATKTAAHIIHTHFMHYM